MAKESRGQKRTVERVMHEYKHGELESGRTGRKVKSRRQAVAIALSESGTSKYQSKSKNRRSFKRTRRKERSGRTAMQETEGRGALRKLENTGRGPVRHRRTTAKQRAAARRAGRASVRKG
jgi:hypothetical protein